MKINYCLRCEHQWPSKLERVLTCAKCRSPYWDVPKGQRDIEPVAEKNRAEASPVVVEQKLSHHDYVRSKLDPEYVVANKQTIEELKAMIAATPAHKSVLPVYTPPPVVPDQPDYYDSENAISIQ